LAVVGIPLAARYLPADEQPEPATLDVVGLVLMAGGIAGVLLGTSNASHDGGFLHPAVLLPLVAGLLAVAVLAWRAVRSPEAALVDLRPLRHRSLSSATARPLVAGSGLCGTLQP